VVDNLSCLCRTGKENESESWILVQNWALRHRAAGRSILFIHHSGKNGEQRGASKREDVLDVVLKLKRPIDYSPLQGARFEIIFEKSRHLTGKDTSTIDARLTTDAEGSQEWNYKDTEQSVYDRVIELKNEGLSQAEIAKELGVNQSTVSRYIKKGQSNGDIKDICM
jgi:predicted XRE-type DNA-binding protein